MASSPLIHKRPINLGCIVIRKDENGKPYTRTLPDGRVIEAPLIQLHHWDLPGDVKLNFALWDYDNEQLPTQFSDFTSQEDGQAFFQKAHDMMQQIAREGGIQALRDGRAAELRQQALEDQVRKLGGTPVTAND